MRLLISIIFITTLSFACKNETSFKTSSPIGARGEVTSDGDLPSLADGSIPSTLLNGDTGTLTIPSTGTDFSIPGLGDIFGTSQPIGGLNDPFGTNPSINPLFNVTPPNTAITQGSFTVWANPSNPASGQDYNVHIEVTLPSSINFNTYTVADLSGCVIGTDQYLYVINKGQRSQSPANTCADQNNYPSSDFRQGFLQQAFSSILGKAHLVIRIPGAERLVRDRVTVSSALLTKMGISGTAIVDLQFN